MNYYHTIIILFYYLISLIINRVMSIPLITTYFQNKEKKDQPHYKIIKMCVCEKNDKLNCKNEFYFPLVTLRNICSNN